MPNQGGKTCCAAAATAQLSYLVVSGHKIAIARLEEILANAENLSNGGEGAVRSELVRLAKQYNYIPPSAEKEYGDALFAEYLTRRSTPEKNGRNEK
jgi:hypothetical protein